MKFKKLNEKAIDLIKKNDKTPRELSVLFNVTPGSIQYYLRKFNIKPKRTCKILWTEEEINILKSEKNMKEMCCLLKRDKRSIYSKMAILKIPIKREVPKWTKDEISILKEGNKTVTEFSKLLDRTYVSIKQKLRNLKLPVISEKCKKWNKEEIEFLKKEYNNKTLKKIGKILNRSKDSVAHKKQQLKLSIPRNKWTKKEIKILKKRNKTIEELSKILGRSYYSVSLKLQKLKITTKKAKRKTIPINHNYFKKWSHNMAYVFGIWCADGNIHKPKTENSYIFDITLHEDDKYLLENISNEMESQYKLYKGKNKHNYYFQVRSKTLFDDIKKLGGMERKSLKLKFPKIFKKYLSDFIRGYFDGDGSVHSSGRSSQLLGTYDFLKEIKKNTDKLNIYTTDIRDKHPNHLKWKNHCFVICINRKNDNKKFCDFIYKNINNKKSDLFLQRKYNRFYRIN